MKRIGIVLAIIVSLAIVAGCVSSGGSSGGSGEIKPYSVDLSTLPLIKNKTPFKQVYDDLLIEFPKFPVDVTQYKRVTINCKYFNEKGDEIAQGDTNAMVTLIYDLKGDIRGPDMGPGKNTPLKEFNVGGYSGLVSTEKGTRVTFTQPLGAILFQNSNPNVKYIEVTEITFHN